MSTCTFSSSGSRLPPRRRCFFVLLSDVPVLSQNAGVIDDYHHCEFLFFASVIRIFTTVWMNFTRIFKTVWSYAYELLSAMNAVLCSFTDSPEVMGTLLAFFGRVLPRQFNGGRTLRICMGKKEEAISKAVSPLTKTGD